LKTKNYLSNHKNIETMKTTIFTIAILFTLVFGVSRATYAANENKEEVSTILTEVNQINQIEVHGNVELYLSEGSTEQVKVYNKYYAESAFVQDENGVLRVSNYSTQKLVVWVTAKDLRNMYVYDGAVVKSFGKLSFIDLDVKLFDHALAQLNLDTYSTTVTLNNHSRADIDGFTTEAVLRYNIGAYLNQSELVAEHVTEERTFEHRFHRHPSEFAAL
jgi:filamentous hemagglutinin family protein